MSVNFLALLILYWIFQNGYSQSYESTYHLYVSQDSSQPCSLEYDSCYTLSQLFQNHEILSSTDRLFVNFSNGNHLLKSENFDTLTFENASLVHMVGLSGPGVPLSSTTIECVSNAGFIFRDIQDVDIINLSFIRCGGPRILNHTTRIFSALFFISLKTLTISNISVYNSSGYGIYAKNIYHQVVVLGSNFLYNGAGNGMLVWNGDTECSNSSLTILSITIENCIFAYGGSLPSHLLSTGGLRMDFNNSCSFGEVRLYAVNMLSNTAHQGGGLSITFGPELKNGIDVSIDNCSFDNGFAYEGGGIYLHAAASYLGSHQPDIIIMHQSFSIINSSVTSNTALEAGGGIYISIELHSQIGRQIITMSDTNISENSVVRKPDRVSSLMTTVGNGGGLFLSISSGSCMFSFERMTFSVNEADNGGGMYLLYVMDSRNTDHLLSRSPSGTIDFLEETNIDRVISSSFTRNQATVGGGINVKVSSLISYTSETKNLQVHNVIFKENCGYLNAPAMAVSENLRALHLELDRVTFSSNFVLTFSDIDDILDCGASPAIAANSPAALFVTGSNQISVRDCLFLDNLVGGLAVFDSTLNISGSLTFVNNTSINGGGMALYSTEIHLTNSTSVIIFEQNHAKGKGGAIYIDDHTHTISLYPQPEHCFINIQANLSTISAYPFKCTFVNNYAGTTGTVLYGGNLDLCNQTSNTFVSKCLVNQSTDFKSVQKFISSDPVQLCVCENEEVLCEVRSINVSTLPGEPFSISMIALGQRNGLTSAIVSVNFPKRVKFSVNGKLQTLPSTGCTNLSYTVSSLRSSEDMTLTVKSAVQPSNLLNLSVNFVPCPKGFTLNSATQSCKCAPALEDIEGIVCNDKDYTIDKHEQVWVDYVCQDLNSSFTDCGIVFHKNCPYHYCNEQLTQFDLGMSNGICTGDRAGVLCGECKEQYSMILGSLECWDCIGKSNRLALIVVFGLLGILLIALLTVLKLTISRGTINGLLYFAAVVQLNQIALFPSALTDNFNIFTMFISWLNLDFGIKTCFYEYMNPQAKLFLQLTFPLYIVILVLIIHLISRHSSRLSRLTGASQRVAIFSTVLLIAFLKILQVLVPVFPYTYITKSHSQIVPVWLYNGNVEYLGTEHLPLFIFAIFLMLFVVLPFTFLLLFGQLLLRLSFFQNHYPGTSVKLRIIVDTYTGQTKLRSLSWMGIIVSTYIIQLVVFHSTGGEVYLNLVMAILGSCFLVGLSLLLGGVYKGKLLNILEWFIFLSIIVMASLAIQLRINGGEIGTNSSVFTTFSFIIFGGIIFYHCIIEFSVFKNLVKRLSSKCSSFKIFKLKNTPYIRYNKLLDYSSDEEDGYQSYQLGLPLEQDNTDSTFPSENTNPNDWVAKDYSVPYFREHPALLSSNKDNISTGKISSDLVRVKSISSSLLVMRHGEDDEADLIPVEDDKKRKQTLMNDDDGIQTFVIEDSTTETGQSLPSPVSQKEVHKLISSNVEKAAENPREEQESSADTNLPSLQTSISGTNHSHDSLPTSEKSNQCNFSYSKIYRRLQPRVYSCHSNRNVRIKKQAQRAKDSTRLPQWKQSKLQNGETLSTLVSEELLTSEISVIRVKSSGKTFNDKEQGISLKVPPGAIPTGVTAVIEIGILSHGPFIFPTSMARVSPVVWICCKQPIIFKKNIAITLPHCLKDVSTHTCSSGNDLELQFMNADHNLHPTSSKKHSTFSFTPLDCGSRSVFQPYTGTLTTSHCCFFCITANKTSPSFLKNVECCLTRIDPKPWCLETTVYFCVSYFLKACFQVLEKQFPKESYEVKSKKCFYFAHSSGPSEPKLKIEISHDLSHEWLLVVENPGNREISASELEFCSENEDSILLKQDCCIYPPRFHVRVSGSSAKCSSSAHIFFQGTVSDIGCGLLLPIVPSFSPCVIDRQIIHQGITRRSGTPVRMDSTNSTRLSSRHMDIIHEDEFSQLFYQPAWGDLDCLVVCKVATKWRDIGIQLRVSPDKLDHISYDNNNTGVQNMLREVLRHWSKNGSPPFQWAYIIRAMQAESVGEQVLAQELIEKLSLCVSYV